MSAPGDLVVGAIDDGVVVVTIARPEARNALRHQTMIELADVIDALDTNVAVRCAVIAGNERVFAAGADIAEMAALDGAALMSHPRTLAWQRLWRAEVPLVAAVEGWALGGGCELVLSCDIAIAGEGARFGQPEITLGWMPGAGGTQRLPRSAGKSLAMQLVLTGDPIDAATARAAGIVSEVVPSGSALERALTVARRVASHPRGATRLAKQAVLRAFDAPIAEGLRDEHASFRHLASTPERAQRMAAFLQRDRPA